MEKSLHFSKLNLNRKIIEETFAEIQGPYVARMMGLISHFVYWSVFGHLNANPIDDYHLKQLFISIAQSMNQLE